MYRLYLKLLLLIYCKYAWANSTNTAADVYMEPPLDESSKLLEHVIARNVTEIKLTELETNPKEKQRGRGAAVSTTLANVSTSTQFPSMSPERRKSYNSIRDRESYFKGRQRRVNDQGQRHQNHHHHNHQQQQRAERPKIAQKMIDVDLLETQETAHRAQDIPKQSVISNRYYEFGVKLPKEISTKLSRLEPWIGTTSLPGDMENLVMPLDKTQKIEPFEEKMARISMNARTGVKEANVRPLPLADDSTYPTKIEINENNKRILSEMSKEMTLTSTEIPVNATLITGMHANGNVTATPAILTTTTTTINVPISTYMMNSNNVTLISKSTNVIAPFTNRTDLVNKTSKEIKFDFDNAISSPSTEPLTKFQMILPTSTEHVLPLTQLFAPTYIKVFVTSSSSSSTTEETPTNDEGDPYINNSSDVGVVVSVVDDEIVLSSQTTGFAVYLLAVFGLVPIILGVVFGIRFYITRTKRKGLCDSLEENSVVPTHVPHIAHRTASGLRKTPSNATTITLVHAPRLPRVPQKCTSWELARQQLTLLSIIGHGNFGQVWKAELLENITTTPRLVAVKTVKEGATDREQDELIKELQVMQQIGHHPNVVTLLGCCTEKEPYYLVMEYVQFGKLLTYLREHRTEENYFNFSTDSSALVAKDLTSFMFCIARGMEYLVSKRIIHRDLAARNVLVDQHKICKIADFGMSRLVQEGGSREIYEERHHKGALPIRWMAPESLQYSVFTHASDAWSFGIVMWEIVTLGSTPYPSLGAREVVQGVRSGLRPQRPRHVRPELWRLAARCWHADADVRPTFTELRSALVTMLDGQTIDLDGFADDNRFQLHARTGPSGRHKQRSAASSKGTITLVGNGSFTVNSNILDNKQFTMV